MLSKEERRANLMRASQETRVQAAQIEDTISNMSNEEIEAFIDQNPEVEDMLCVSADKDNRGIFVNYAEMENNKLEKEISFNPPWEGNFSRPGQTGHVNLFQVGQQPSNGFTFGENGYNNYRPDDERLTKFTPGMKLYNLNPYNFYNAEQMINYYNDLERRREIETNTQYTFAMFMARTVNEEQAYEWAEQFKFKPADQIYKEQEEERERLEKEKQDALFEDGNDIAYDVYDINGVRYQKERSFRLIKAETGEVIKEVKFKKDKLGHSYSVHTQIEDRKEQFEQEQIMIKINQAKVYAERAKELMDQAYINNINRWKKWDEEGLSLAEQYARYEDERIDWKAQERRIQRALVTCAFSKDNFNKIINGCCKELTYENHPKFFSLSYDFDRDLHYKSLISTPEEMNSDPVVQQRIQQEYEIKRKLFIDKVMSGNLGCAMAMTAGIRPTIPKPNIDELTLEDYDKPENQIMYSKLCAPSVATDNAFIPSKPKAPQMSKEELAAIGIHLDENGNIIPQQRTMGIISVDDETGQIISQQEFDVTPPKKEDELPDVSGNMSDEELSKYF